MYRLRSLRKGLSEIHHRAQEQGPSRYEGIRFLCHKDKGAVARKACSAACIGCGKCAKVCASEAITVENNVAYIDFTKCRLCKKCVAECPTGAIHDVNFPVLKPKVAPVEEKKEENNG